MELNKTLVRIKKLQDERGWTIYRLAKESNIPYSSLNALFLKNNNPTISTLEKICAGFNMTLSEFFSDEPPYRNVGKILSNEDELMLNTFNSLSKKNKQKIYEIALILKK